MLSWQVGPVKITGIVEMDLPVPAKVIKQATAAELRRLAWLDPHFVSEDDATLKLSIHTVLIDLPGLKLIVDTCVGNDRPRETTGGQPLATPFLQHLQEAGWSRDGVDAVVCTHLHVDHVGWKTPVLVIGSHFDERPQDKAAPERLDRIQVGADSHKSYYGTDNCETIMNVETCPPSSQAAAPAPADSHSALTRRKRNARSTPCRTRASATNSSKRCARSPRLRRGPAALSVTPGAGSAAVPDGFGTDLLSEASSKIGELSAEFELGEEKLVVLIPHIMLVIVTLRCRRAVASFIRAPAGRRDLLSFLRNRFADVWHYLAIFANLALWAVCAFRIPNFTACSPITLQWRS